MRAIAPRCKFFFTNDIEPPWLAVPEPAYKPLLARGVDGIFAHRPQAFTLVCPAMHPVLLAGTPLDGLPNLQRQRRGVA